MDGQQRRWALSVLGQPSRELRLLYKPRTIAPSTTPPAAPKAAPRARPAPPARISPMVAPMPVPRMSPNPTVLSRQSLVRCWLTRVSRFRVGMRPLLREYDRDTSIDRVANVTHPLPSGHAHVRAHDSPLLTNGCRPRLLRRSPIAPCSEHFYGASDTAVPAEAHDCGL